jgi:glutamyl-Q tRNA(Asp) synthetase
VGRFAPSPTGPLHLGSLVAALGSYADARHRRGRWLVRMEDLDHARVIPGCADAMLRILEHFGLTWDGVVEYQSQRGAHYAQALEALRAAGVTFECSCSRRELTDEGGYPGTCRVGPMRAGPTAVRFRVPDSTVEFDDRAQGHVAFRLSERGDVIVRRRDGAYAYQLAVVVDDHLQAVTDVVRGADLLDSTPWQMALQRALGFATPAYLHLPLVCEPDGKKLSKSMRSVGLDPERSGAQLFEALTLLLQSPPPGLEREPPRSIVAWACANWQPQHFQTVRKVRASDTQR